MSGLKASHCRLVIVLCNCWGSRLSPLPLPNQASEDLSLFVFRFRISDELAPTMRPCGLLPGMRSTGRAWSRPDSASGVLWAGLLFDALPYGGRSW